MANYWLRGFLAFVFLAAVLPREASAQIYDIKVYSVNDGLPQQQLAGVTQDRHGYMWFATYGDGLARFDGYEYHQVTTEDGLRDDAAYEVYYDSRNRLWTSTESGGLARVRGDSVFYRFQDTALDTLVVHAIGEQGGSLWLGTYGGGLYTLSGDSLSAITAGDGLRSDIVWDVMEFDADTWWVATHSGVSVVHREGGGSRKPIDSSWNFELLEGTGDLSVYSIYRVGEEIWMATSDGLRIWKDESLRAVRAADGEEMGYVYDIEADRDGTVWVGTAANGLFRWDGREFAHISEREGLSSDWMYELYRDRNGRIWAATDENGVNLIRSNTFLRYNHKVAPFLGTIYGLYHSSRETLWAGTEAGLVRWDGNGFSLVPSPVDTLPDPVWIITERPDGTLLLVLDDNTIVEYDGSTYRNFTERAGLEKVHTIDVLADSRGRVWIARSDGLLRYEDGDSRLLTGADGLPTYVVWNVYEDPNGNIWFATDAGLSLYREDGTFRNFTEEDGLPDEEISHLTHGPQGDLWAGTMNGIARLQFSEDSSEVLIESLGPIHATHRDDTQFLVFDAWGYLWQGTNAGIHRIDVPGYLESGELKVAHHAFDAPGEGLETIHKAVARDARGRLWFGTVEGIIRYDPMLEYGDEIHPQVNVTAIETGSGTMHISESEQSPDVSTDEDPRFPYDENDVAISYTATDYFNPGQVLYSYRLQGFSDGWSEPGRTRQAVFTNLPPGEYRFEVRAQNSQGNWSTRNAALGFRVAAPFWQRTWFLVLAGLALVGGAGLFARLRLHYLERHKLRQLVEERTSDLREALGEKEVLLKEVHHRVKNNLAVVTGLLQMQEFDAEDEYTRDVLQDSQMRIKSISLVHEKLYQSDNLASVRFSEYMDELLDAIQTTFGQVDERVVLKKELEHFSLPVNLAIPSSLILNELVTNAYKHAFSKQENGIVSVSTYCSGGMVILEVRDDGKGLPDDFSIEDQTSLGMSLIQTLSEQLSGTLEFRNEEGAVFRVSYPLDQPE